MLRRARIEALEEAARVARHHILPPSFIANGTKREAGLKIREEIAAAISALREKPCTTQEVPS
jgi:hypothetical protein